MINVADIVQNDIADLFTLGVIDVDEEAMEVEEVDDDDDEAVVVIVDDDDQVAENRAEVEENVVENGAQNEQAPVIVDPCARGHRRRKREREDYVRCDVSAGAKLALVKFYRDEPDAKKRLEQRQEISKATGCELIRNQQIAEWTKQEAALQAQSRRFGTKAVQRLTSRRNVTENLCLDNSLWAKVAAAVKYKRSFTSVC